MALTWIKKGNLKGPKGDNGAVPTDEAVASYLSDVDSKSHAAVDALLPVLLRDVVVQRDNTSLMVPRRRVYLNCTFDQNYPDEQMRSADDIVFINCKFIKPAGRLWTMSGRDERKGLARSTFVNCTFKGSYSSDDDDFRNHQIVFQNMSGIEFSNCSFMDIGVRVDSDVKNEGPIGTLCVTGCTFGRSNWGEYKTETPENDPKFSHKEFLSITSKYIAQVDSCVFDGRQAKWDSLDLYNLWGATVSGCKFYASDAVASVEAKSIFDGKSGGTYGNETNVTGAQVQITFEDCVFSGEESARNWVAVSAMTYTRNGYMGNSGKSQSTKHVNLVRCRVIGDGGTLVSTSDTNVTLRDCMVNRSTIASNRLITFEAGPVGFDVLVHVESCVGTLAFRSWTESSHTRVEAYDSVLYLVMIDDTITLNNVMFTRCRFNTNGQVTDGTYGCYSDAAGTIVMRDCEYTTFKLANGQLEAYGCRMDSLGIFASMHLEHCHTKDINTGTITGQVEYRDLTYDTGTPDKNKLAPLNIKEVGAKPTVDLPVFAVNAISDTTSLDGDAIVKPCVLILPNATPPAIYYSTKINR